MPKSKFLTTDKASGRSVTIEYDQASGIADKAWEDLIEGDHSVRVDVNVSKAVAEALNVLADHDWTVKAQAAIRSVLAKHGVDAAKKKGAEYKYGARGGSIVVEVKTIDASIIPGLTLEQAKAMLAGGYRLTNIPEEIAKKLAAGK